LANTQSALKQMRQNEKRRLRNSAVRSKMKGAVKTARMALEKGQATVAQSEIRRAAVTVDTAASKGVIHRNTAARMKSRLARRLNKLAVQPPTH